MKRKKKYQMSPQKLCSFWPNKKCVYVDVLRSLLILCEKTLVRAHIS